MCGDSTAGERFKEQVVEEVRKDGTFHSTSSPEANKERQMRKGVTA